MHPPRRWRKRALLAGAGALFAFGLGCPARFDPRAEPIAVQSSDPAASKAYHDARARLDAGEFREAQTRFRAFVSTYPTDPLVPNAKLWEARADLGAGDAGEAAKVAQPLAEKPGAPADDPVAERARYLLGLALARSDKREDAAQARALLKPFEPRVHGDEAVELHAALAEAASHAGAESLAEALDEYAQFYDGARAPERAYVRERAAKLLGALDDPSAARVLDAAAKDGLACAILGPRLAEGRRKAGDPAGARTLEAEAQSARRRFALDEARGKGAAIDREGGIALGLVVPLSGRNRLIGERALRGAVLAADALPPSAKTFEVRVRDSESSPEKAAAALEELARTGVAAVVGSPDRAEAQAQAARAEALGVPLLELAPPIEGAAPANEEAARLSFRMLRPNAARAEALAAQALALGSKRPAVLFPDSSYGRKMADAFAQVVRGRGVPLVAEQKYDEKATTFIQPVKQLAGARPDAIFIPAPAGQLELVAAQLAASGLTKTQGASGHKLGALLCATADGLSPKLLQSVGRYVQGALLAPVFYPDAADQQIAPFVERFRQSFGDEPGAADALSFDAVRAVRLGLDGLDLAEGRAGLARRIAAGDAPGVTGLLRFGPRGERGGAAQIYVVDGDAIRALR